MTSETSEDLKIVIFIVQSVKDDYQCLPPNVFDSANRATASLQNNYYLPKGMASSLKGPLCGITEVRIEEDTNTFRVYYAANFPTALYILDAGMKKSHRGGEIPKEQKERLKSRYKMASDHYEKNRIQFEEDAHKRAMARQEPNNKLQ